MKRLNIDLSQEILDFEREFEEIVKKENLNKCSRDNMKSGYSANSLSERETVEFCQTSENL